MVLGLRKAVRGALGHGCKIPDLCIRPPAPVEHMGMKQKRHLTGGLALLLGLALLPLSCASREPSRNPLGEIFPAVGAETLEGAELRIPEDLSGRPAVLLIGYVQKAQFDADRWLLGLLQAELDVAVYEVPTIPGALVGLMSGNIDSGMRSGIPSEDWGSVATVYGGDAGEIERFTGSEGPRNIRVVLLDAQGKVCWFHDRGYSAGSLLDLEGALGELTR